MHFVRIIQAYQIWVQILIKSKSADIHVMYCNTRFNIKVKLHYWRYFRWYWRQESIKNLIFNYEDIKFEFNGILFISRTNKSNLDRCYHGPEVMCPGRDALWNLSRRGPWYALWYLQNQAVPCVLKSASLRPLKIAFTCANPNRKRWV